MPAFSCCRNSAYCMYNSGSYQLLPVKRKEKNLTVPVSIKDLMSAMDKIGIQCVSDSNLNTDTEIRVLPENNPDYAFQVAYNAKINERNLIFCLASAMGDILLHRIDFSK